MAPAGGPAPVWGGADRTRPRGQRHQRTLLLLVAVVGCLVAAWLVLGQLRAATDVLACTWAREHADATATTSPDCAEARP